MGAFILAGVIFVLSVGAAAFVAFAEGMRTAPEYDNMPAVILIGGCVLAAIVASTHWVHIGW